MFATKKALDNHIDTTKYELKKLQNKYWLLLDKYELLLKHFGLSEHTTPETTELITKDSPER